MAEERYVHSANGQEVDQSDLNLLGEVGAFADDRILAELLRLAPSTGPIVKAILPFGHVGSSRPTVGPSGASGSVAVSPFRLVVGARDTLANIGPKAYWHDLRSGIFTGGDALEQRVQLLANTSGFTRWDLVYAVLAVDADGPTVPRFRKDPTTETVAVINTVRSKLQRVTVAVLTGTPAAQPQRPVVPPDAAGNYFVPLAFVRVPDAFGATTTVASTDIDEQIPFVPMSRTMGTVSVTPANRQRAFAWKPTPGHRPRPYLPGTMAGGDSILVALDLLNASSADWSHGNGSIIDDSRDWRSRAFHWTAHLRTGTAFYAWDRNAPAGASLCPQATFGATLGSRLALGVGQSFRADGPDPTSCVAVYLDTTVASEISAGARILVYVDSTDGALKLLVTGIPTVLVFLWLNGSAPYPNA